MIFIKFLLKGTQRIILLWIIRIIFKELIMIQMKIFMIPSYGILNNYLAFKIVRNFSLHNLTYMIRVRIIKNSHLLNIKIMQLKFIQKIMNLVDLKALINTNWTQLYIEIVALSLLCSWVVVLNLFPNDIVIQSL